VGLRLGLESGLLLGLGSVIGSTFNISMAVNENLDLLIIDSSVLCILLGLGLGQELGLGLGLRFQQIYDSE
jgi:hypothetical protein